MQANPVFIMQTLCVCAGSKQILFFYNWNLFFYERCFLILMLGVYFLTISYITIKQSIFL
jgi:hypothetical protein